MKSRRRQQGVALIVFATVLVLGMAWFTVGALGQAPLTTPEREAETGRALQEAKRALLAYVAQYAARPDTVTPGQMPCPESVSLASPGEASTSCSATGLNVGRLPWKTLGIDQIRDGYGEPLWYMVRGFRNPPINFGTPGQLQLNGETVVALIVAPGVPMQTRSTPGTPPLGCGKQDQMVAARNTAPLNPANFIECGVGTGSVASPGNATWTNDRVIAITAEEWADAIAPAIADRMQRQVAPAMETFRTTTSVTSWGRSYLPNASTLSATSPTTFPEHNNLCGNVGVRSGMPPTATVASGTCGTNWTGYVAPPASDLGSLLTGLLEFGGCALVTVPAAGVRCTFTVLVSGFGFLNPRITLVAPNVGYAFRYVDTSQIRYQIGAGSWQPASASILTGSVDPADGTGNFTFRVSLPLGLLTTLRVFIPHPTDALLADARSAWWINNGWDRYTYYGVSRAATHDPGFAVCNPGGTVTNCLTVSNMPSPANDKRLVLVLTGRRLDGKSWPSPPYDAILNPNPLSHYWERDNADGDVVYETGIQAPKDATNPFNDWVAACPFRQTNAGGSNVAICG